ncbi:3-hydroxyacyl-CoA dehydrogenase family protein [Acidobacteriota bacterium]
MNSNKEFQNLVKEPELKQRKGGVANLILVALFLEAARMVDDGFDIPSIEAAAKEAFEIPRGFLSLMDNMGIKIVIDNMSALADSSNPENPLFQVYNNFFTPAESCNAILEIYERSNNKLSVKWISEENSGKKPPDFLIIDLLLRRFQAVAFIIASEVVDSGVIELGKVDNLCMTVFHWPEGLFARMNRLGIGEVMRMVIERMEHSQERN